MFERLLVRLHPFNLTADARNLLFHLKHVFDLSRALRQYVPQPLLRLAGVLQACGQIRVPLRHLFPALRFADHPTERLYLRNSGSHFSRRNAQRVLKNSWSIVCGGSAEMRRVAVVTKHDCVERGASGREVPHHNVEIDSARNHGRGRGRGRVETCQAIRPAVNCAADRSGFQRDGFIRNGLFMNAVKQAV